MHRGATIWFVRFMWWSTGIVTIASATDYFLQGVARLRAARADARPDHAAADYTDDTESGRVRHGLGSDQHRD